MTPVSCSRVTVCRWARRPHVSGCGCNALTGDHVSRGGIQGEGGRSGARRLQAQGGGGGGVAARGTGKAAHLNFPRPEDRAPSVLAEPRTLVTPVLPPRRCHSGSRDTKLLHVPSVVVVAQRCFRGAAWDGVCGPGSLRGMDERGEVGSRPPAYRQCFSRAV